MKKISLHLSVMLFSCILLSIGSCTKSTSSTGNNSGNNGNSGSVSGLIASRTSVTTSGGSSVTTVANYSYDGQGRLTGYTLTNVNPVSYTYGSGTVTQTQGNSTVVYTLNSNGLAVSDNMGDTYNYDNNGFLLSETNPNGASTINTINNGNIVKTVQTTTAGSSTSYTYSFAGTPEYRSYGTPFLGKGNTDVPISEAINSSAYNITYTYDGKGRVQTQKIVSGTLTLQLTFSYVN